jgi:hypothetical protein
VGSGLQRAPSSIMTRPTRGSRGPWLRVAGRRGCSSPPQDIRARAVILIPRARLTICSAAVLMAGGVLGLLNRATSGTRATTRCHRLGRFARRPESSRSWGLHRNHNAGSAGRLSGQWDSCGAQLPAGLRHRMAAMLSAAEGGLDDLYQAVAGWRESTADISTLSSLRTRAWSRRHN